MSTLEVLNEQFETSSPQDILQWAFDTYKPKIGLSSSFGAQSAVLLHMTTQIWPKVPVFFIDTGFLFKETHTFAEYLKERMNLNLKKWSPTEGQIDKVRQLLQINAPTCCDEVKVEGMQWALEGLDCWIAGLRRGQAKTRKNIKIVEEYGEGLVKVHPIANWTSKDVDAYMKAHDLPYHPLWEKGYKSIGCEPCTRKPADQADARSGRWAGKEKTECGIHTFMKKKKK